MYWKKGAHEGPWKKNGHMKVHEKKAAMPQNIRRERPNHGLPYSFAFHSIHHIPTHMHFSIMVVWLVYSLGPIFDFAKYLRQVCLSFSPYLELHQKAFRSMRKKAHKRPWWGYKHFWANESVIGGTCFLFFLKTFWKPPDVILSKEWVSVALWIVLSLNRPRQGESQKPHED